MCSARDNAALPTLGFPIRASAGHWPFSASPRLIAAVHALHRLLVPRHPPCALTILTVILGESTKLSPGDTRVIGYCAAFKVREEARPGTVAGLVSQNSTACGRPNGRGDESHPPICAPPGPVDILSSDRAQPAGRELRRSKP